MIPFFLIGCASTSQQPSRSLASVKTPFQRSLASFEKKIDLNGKPISLSDESVQQEIIQMKKDLEGDPSIENLIMFSELIKKVFHDNPLFNLQSADVFDRLMMQFFPEIPSEVCRKYIKKEKVTKPICFYMLKQPGTSILILGAYLNNKDLIERVLGAEDLHRVASEELAHDVSNAVLKGLERKKVLKLILKAFNVALNLSQNFQLQNANSDATRAHIRDMFKRGYPQYMDKVTSNIIHEIQRKKEEGENFKDIGPAHFSYKLVSLMMTSKKDEKNHFILLMKKIIDILYSDVRSGIFHTTEPLADAIAAGGTGEISSISIDPKRIENFDLQHSKTLNEKIAPLVKKFTQEMLKKLRKKPSRREEVNKPREKRSQAAGLLILAQAG